MGYAEGPEGNMKRERKGSDNGSRRDNDDDDEEEDDNRSVDGTVTRRENGHMQRQSHGSYPGASPEQKRMDSKQQTHSSYNPSPPKRQDTRDGGKGRGSFMEYRDSAVFSDETQSPTSMLS